MRWELPHLVQNPAVDSMPSRLTAEKPGSVFARQLGAAQESFYRHCRYAQYSLALFGLGRDNTALTATLSSLEEANKQLAHSSSECLHNNDTNV